MEASFTHRIKNKGTTFFYLTILTFFLSKGYNRKICTLNSEEKKAYINRIFLQFQVYILQFWLFSLNSDFTSCISYFFHHKIKSKKRNCDFFISQLANVSLYLSIPTFFSQNTRMTWDVDSELWEKLLLWHKNCNTFFIMWQKQASIQNRNCHTQPELISL